MVKLHVQKGGGKGFPGVVESCKMGKWESRDGAREMEGLRVQVEGNEWSHNYSVSYDPETGAVYGVSNCGIFLEQLHELGFDTEKESFDTDQIVGLRFLWDKRLIAEGTEYERKLTLPTVLLDKKKGGAKKKLNDAGKRKLIIKVVTKLDDDATRPQIFSALRKAGYESLIDEWPELFKAMKKEGLLAKQGKVYVTLDEEEDDEEEEEAPPPKKKKAQKAKPVEEEFEDFEDDEDEDEE